MAKRLDQYRDFLEKPLSMQEMFRIMKDYNLVCEKISLFRDFLESLTIFVQDTYFGPEYIRTDYDIEGHFRWCWKKNISVFADEGYVFNISEEDYGFFLDFYMAEFYKAQNRHSDESIRRLLLMWRSTINYSSIKTKFDLEHLIEVYQMLDEKLTFKRGSF